MPCVAQHWLARKSFLYLSNLVLRPWFIVPNLAITPSGIRIFIVPRMRFLSPDYALLDKSPRQMYFGRLFHVIWNAVPVELEPYSNLAGTGVQLSRNKAGAEKAHYKSLSGEV